MKARSSRLALDMNSTNFYMGGVFRIARSASILSFHKRWRIFLSKGWNFSVRLLESDSIVESDDGMNAES